MTGKKNRIALFGIGTLGGDRSGQGIPVLADLFERLSAHYEIVFYSFTRVQVENVSSVIKVRQIMRTRFPWRLKFLFLFFTAIIDHIRHPYALLFSVSAYPSGLFALTLGKIIRRRVVVQLIASEATNIEGISAHSSRSWLWKITKFVCKHADYLVTVADYQRKLAREALSTTRTIDMLPLRINPSNFIYRKRQLSTPVQFIQVAFYGRVKDQDTMFKAFARVVDKVDAHLTLVGFGFDSPAVTRLLKELGIQDKITIAGFVPQENLPAYYDRMHVLLHTARFETGCAVIQEAMASGVAVCGTNVGLLADIGDAYAAIVPPRDPDKLSFAILNLVADPSMYARLTDNAYEWIRQNDAAWMYENYHRYLEKILRDKYQPQE